MGVWCVSPEWGSQELDADLLVTGPCGGPQGDPPRRRLRPPGPVVSDTAPTPKSPSGAPLQSSTPPQ